MHDIKPVAYICRLFLPWKAFGREKDNTEINENLDTTKIGPLKLKNLGTVEYNHMKHSPHSPFKLNKHTQKIY